MDVVPASFLAYLQSFDRLTGMLVFAAAVAVIVVAIARRRFRRSILVPSAFLAGYAGQVAANSIWLITTDRPAPVIGDYLAALSMCLAVFMATKGAGRAVSAD